MTVAEFFGCAFLAFGAPLAMFVFTIADSPIKIILLIFSSFLWLLSLLSSSFVWFIIVPLRDYLFFGVIVSVFIQVSIYWLDNISMFNLNSAFRKGSGMQSTSCWIKPVLGWKNLLETHSLLTTSQCSRMFPDSDLDSFLGCDSSYQLCNFFNYIVPILAFPVGEHIGRCYRARNDGSQGRH